MGTTHLGSGTPLKAGLSPAAAHLKAAASAAEQRITNRREMEKYDISRYVIFFVFSLYGFWEGLVWCKILPRGVGTICPYFWEVIFSAKRWEVSTIFFRAYFRLFPESGNPRSVNYVFSGIFSGFAVIRRIIDGIWCHSSNFRPDLVSFAELLSGFDVIRQIFAHDGW